MARYYVRLVGLFLLLVLQLSGTAGASRLLHQSSKNTNAPVLETAWFPNAIADSVGGLNKTNEGDSQDTDHSVFESSPLGWNMDTIRLLYNWTASLPGKTPGLFRHAIDQGHMFGALGSCLLIVFAATMLYGLIGQKRVLGKVEQELQPLWERIPALSRHHLLSFINIVVSSLLPIVLLCAFLPIEGFIHSKVSWFVLVKKLLGLWVIGSLSLNFLREILTNGLLPFCPRYGKTLLRVLRLALTYLLAGIALVWGADAIELPQDVLAFLRFAFSLTVVLILSTLLLKKAALLSLLPLLPSRTYTAFTRFIDKFYVLLAVLTFLSGILWCFGYHRLAAAAWIKTWGVAAAYVLIMVSYHHLLRRLQRLSDREDHRHDEAAQFFFQSTKNLLQYVTVAIGSVIIMDLLGVLEPIYSVISMTVYTVGETPLSFWVIIEAGIIMLAFIYASRLLRAYLDYRIYPSTGIDTGLGYALNTFLRYLFIATGFICALRVVGLDLRVLMVFAGGVGIGTGLGLQNITANIISGFVIVFGRKLRKGDWIKVGDKLGMVTHIYLRATKIWTRDNIEYIVPNTDFISKPIVNYTLSSPIVRVYIPVGVSYNTPPPPGSKNPAESRGETSNSDEI
jgi:small-conductance mechanosensitive channel